MREILFRGKRVGYGEWVYGLLVDVGKESSFIRSWGKDRFGYYDFLVFSETVGQYTGLTDKNGKKIFEGDIIRCKLLGFYCAPIISKVTTKIGAYGMEWQLGNDTKFTAFYNANMLNYEVIGNIHDSPELLEVE